MDSQDQERHSVERIMRRAAALGHDPERVGRALNRGPDAPVEYQPVMEVEPRSWFGVRAARRFARRS